MPGEGPQAAPPFVLNTVGMALTLYAIYLYRKIEKEGP